MEEHELKESLPPLHQPNSDGTPCEREGPDKYLCSNRPTGDFLFYLTKFSCDDSSCGCHEVLYGSFHMLPPSEFLCHKESWAHCSYYLRSTIGLMCIYHNVHERYRSTIFLPHAYRSPMYFNIRRRLKMYPSCLSLEKNTCALCNFKASIFINHTLVRCILNL